MVTKVAAKRAASWKLSTSKAWKMTSLIDDLNEFKFPSLKSLKVKKQEGQGETLHYLWIQLKSYFYLSEARELRECYLVLTEMFTKCFSAYNQKTWAESIPTSIFEMYRLKQNDKGTLRWIHSWFHFRIIFKLFSWPANEWLKVLYGINCNESFSIMILMLNGISATFWKRMCCQRATTFCFVYHTAHTGKVTPGVLYKGVNEEEEVPKNCWLKKTFFNTL